MRPLTGRARAVLGVAAVGVALVGCAGGSTPAPTAEAPRTSAPTASEARPGEVQSVSLGGTLDRSGDRLVGRITLTNEGSAPVWVPVGREGQSRPRLLPAAAGDGVVDLGWVVPPTPTDVDGVPSGVVFRSVEPGTSLELEATDDPPPAEALLDTAGGPVEVTTYRLCIDAFADATLPDAARRPVDGSVATVAADGDVVLDVDDLDGDASRRCGPTLPA